MKGLFLLIGESFRTGSQGSRIRGEVKSLHEQEIACYSHIDFIKFLKKKHNIDINVFLTSYHTRYDKRLLKIYKNYLVGNGFFDRPMGLNRLYDESMKKIPKNMFDFLFIIRIDLFLKPYLFEIYKPWEKIMYPTICWTLHGRDHMSWKNDKYPRINDMMIYIPKKYNNCRIRIGHESWYLLRVQNREIKDEDIDVMIKTFHDSDSQKDWNPLYRIVNRPQAKNWFSKGQEFNINNKEGNFIDKSEITYDIKQ